MLPARFDYVAVSSVEEAIAAKAEGGDETRFLAGGQSLLPMMKLRFATPARLVDINRIAGLDTIERHNGHLRIGALVRHADVAASAAVSGAVASAAPWISDPLVRNLGTVCGSVAHCDPEGDWNSVLLATGAEVVAEGPSGRRSIDIADFVQDLFTSSLAEDEMVTALHVPVPSGPSGGSYQNLELAADGTIAAAGVAMTSVAPINRKAADAEALLVGSAPSAELFAAAGEAAAAAAEPRDDVRGSARWKRSVVAAFTRRALADAVGQARS